jgi:hypothetical protein
MNDKKIKTCLVNMSNINYILKNENTILLLILIYLIMLALNYITPMIFGDDYVYAFVWQKNQAINTPLPETARRLSSFKDILVSQWNHYFYWGGRTVAHIFVQFFAWIGKDIFNIFNSLVFTILLLQISWIANRGRISLKNVNHNIIILTFFIFWFFTAGFSVVYLWMTGACNYVWTMVILLFFLIPYIRHYFQVRTDFFNKSIIKILFFCFGIIAGWTNENTICWLICILGIWLFSLYKSNRLHDWMLYGYIGFCLGYCLLILAPGNAVRMTLVVGDSLRFMEWSHFRGRLLCFLAIEFFQALIWIYVLKSFEYLKLINNGLHSKYLKLAKIFCVLSLLSNVIMLFVPDFQPRSGFPSLVFLTIALVLILKARYFNQQVPKWNAVSIFILLQCGLFFLITLAVTFMISFKVFSYTEYVIHEIKSYSAKEIIYVNAFTKIPESLWHASGLHLIINELNVNEGDSKNVAVSRFFNVKGVSVRKP